MPTTLGTGATWSFRLLSAVFGGVTSGNGSSVIFYAAPGTITSSTSTMDGVSITEGWFDGASYDGYYRRPAVASDVAVNLGTTRRIRQELAQQFAEREERAAQVRAERREARSRALDLLLRYLPEPLGREYRFSQTLTFEGSDGARYRLHSNGYTGNISRIVDGRRERYCAHPEAHDSEGRPLPIEDILLAQYLALVHDAPGLLEIANPA